MAKGSGGTKSSSWRTKKGSHRLGMKTFNKDGTFDTPSLHHTDNIEEITTEESALWVKERGGYKSENEAYGIARAIEVYTAGASAFKKIYNNSPRVISKIDNYIERAPKWHGSLMRGINLDDNSYNDLMYMAKEGMVLKRIGMSWTSNRNVAINAASQKKGNKVVFITRGRNNKATSIRKISYKVGEDEVLVHSKASFRPQSIYKRNGITYIALKVIDN